MNNSTYSISDLYKKRIISDEEKSYLAEYDIKRYFRPSVSTDIAAFTIKNKNEENYRKEEKASLLILMVKRGTHPFKDCWALPGGFLREKESVEECAYREITEETNIKPISIKHIGVFSEVDRDPRGRIISNAFTSIIYDSEGEIISGEDADDARWFEVIVESREEMYYLSLKNGDIELKAVLRESKNEFGTKRFEIIESKDIAFDHASIIGSALSTLRKDVIDLDILFDFLPEKFTLLSLQRVQETILDKELLPANFRRKVMPYVEETDEYVTGAGHRPAKLFVRKKN